MVKLAAYTALLAAFSLPTAFARLSLGKADSSGYACYTGVLNVDANLDATNCIDETKFVFSKSQDGLFESWAKRNGFGTGNDKQGRYITIKPGQTFTVPQALGLKSCALAITNTGKSTYNSHSITNYWIPTFITDRCPTFGSATNVPAGHKASWGGVNTSKESGLRYTLTRVVGQV